MLNLLGFKINPVIGIVAGIGLVVAGLAIARPLLAGAGAVMIVAAGSRLTGARRERPRDRSR